jgi:hypothetical protein
VVIVKVVQDLVIRILKGTVGKGLESGREDGFQTSSMERLSR